MCLCFSSSDSSRHMRPIVAPISQIEKPGFAAFTCCHTCARPLQLIVGIGKSEVCDTVIFFCLWIPGIVGCCKQTVLVHVYDVVSFLSCFCKKIFLCCLLHGMYDVIINMNWITKCKNIWENSSKIIPSWANVNCKHKIVSKSNTGLNSHVTSIQSRKSVDNLLISRSACMEWEVFLAALVILVWEVPVAAWTYSQLDSHWSTVFLTPFHVLSSTPPIT